MMRTTTMSQMTTQEITITIIIYTILAGPCYETPVEYVDSDWNMECSIHQTEKPTTGISSPNMNN